MACSKCAPPAKEPNLCALHFGQEQNRTRKSFKSCSEIKRLHNLQWKMRLTPSRGREEPTQSWSHDKATYLGIKVQCPCRRVCTCGYRYCASLAKLVLKSASRPVSKGVRSNQGAGPRSGVVGSGGGLDTRGPSGGVTGLPLEKGEEGAPAPVVGRRRGDGGSALMSGDERHQLVMSTRVAPACKVARMSKGKRR
jgi:hypothetical protein